MAMVNSSAENQSDGLLEYGAMPITWQSDTSFSDFIEMAFPTKEEVYSAQDGARQQLTPTRNTRWTGLTAKRLKRTAGLELIPTDNLQNHLRLDVKYRTVEIYHHTSVLKEHLASSLNCDRHDDIGRAISE
jgi:hypothetical protein